MTLSLNNQHRFLETGSAYLQTAALGGIGLAVFYKLHMPLPFLLGPLTAMFCTLRTNFHSAWPASFMLPARVCLGLVAGLSFTPALFDRLPQLAASLALLAPMTGLSILIGFCLFTRFAHFDAPTAFFAAVPGGFQDMVAMGHDAGADVRKLSLIHSTRLIMLVYILPFWIVWSEGLPNANITVPHAAQALTLQDVALLCAAAFGGRYLGLWLRLSGSAIVGPMLIAAALSMAGLTHAHLPAWLIDLAQFILGIHIGSRLKGVTARDFFSSITYGILFTALLLMMAAATAKLATWVVDVKWSSALMAFSPGGQAEKNILAIALHADVAYVALHHLIRLAMVVIGAQVLSRFAAGQTSSDVLLDPLKQPAE